MAGVSEEFIDDVWDIFVDNVLWAAKDRLAVKNAIRFLLVSKWAVLPRQPRVETVGSTNASPQWHDKQYDD